MENTVYAYRGRPLAEMSKEELIDVIQYLSDTLNSERKSNLDANIARVHAMADYARARMGIA